MPTYVMPNPPWPSTRPTRYDPASMLPHSSWCAAFSQEALSNPQCGHTPFGSLSSFMQFMQMVFGSIIPVLHFLLIAIV